MLKKALFKKGQKVFDPQSKSIGSISSSVITPINERWYVIELEKFKKTIKEKELENAG